MSLKTHVEIALVLEKLTSTNEVKIYVKSVTYDPIREVCKKLHLSLLLSGSWYYLSQAPATRPRKYETVLFDRGTEVFCEGAS